MAKDQGSNNNTATLALVAAGAVAVYFLYNYFSSDDDSALDVTIDPSKLTYSNNWYKLQADNLQQHLWAYCASLFGCEDDQAVANILMQVDTDHDWYKLILEYGQRGPTDWLESFFWPDLNLIETIARYLDQDQVDQVNTNWSSKNLQSRL